MNKEKYVLVIGSKPNSRLPKLDVLKIYTANGAAERANIYSNEFGSKELIAVVGTMEFLKNQAVRERILNSNPNLIHFRSGHLTKVLIEKYLPDLKYISKSRNQQVLFQSKFLRFGILPILTGEFTQEKKLYLKFNHIFKIILHKGMLGASTGLYSIMLAKFENPSCKIIISGIGITKTGDTFYGTKGTTKRAEVDKKIYAAMDSTIKRDLITTDEDTAKNCNIPLYEKII